MRSLRNIFTANAQPDSACRVAEGGILCYARREASCLPLRRAVPALSQPAARPSALLKKLLLLLAVLLPFFAAAQEIVPPEVDYPYRRDIEKLRFDKAEEKVLRHLSRDSNDIPCRYAAFYLYSDRSNPNKNLRLAYRHIVSLRSLYRASDAKEAIRLERDNITASRIEYDLRSLALQAQADAHASGTIDAYDAFLNTYLLAPSEIRERVVFSRDSLEYRQACAIGSFDDIQNFIDRRPNSDWLPQAISRRDSLAFVEADSKHTTAAYESFRTSYPNSRLVPRATDSIYLLDYRDVRLLDAEQYYRGYALRYPKSPYTPRTLWRADSLEFYRLTDTADWRSFIRYLDIRDASTAPHSSPLASAISWPDKALNLLAQFSLRSGNLEALREAANRLPASHRQLPDVALRLHDTYLHTSITNFSKFYNAYPHLLPDSVRSADSAACALYRQYRESSQFAAKPEMLDSCIRVLAPCHEALTILQHLLKEPLDKGRWDLALEQAQHYADLFEHDADYHSLCATLAAASHADIKATTLGAPVNSLKGNEYSPVLSLDGSTLFFSANNRPDQPGAAASSQVGGADLYVSRLNGKTWRTPTVVEGLCHALGDESPVSVSADGQTLLLNMSGNFYTAQQDSDGWRITPIIDIVRQHSTLSIQAIDGAYMAADGRTLLFSARSLTEREADSSLNLFATQRLADGSWSQPVELGATLNTPYNETAPCLHADLRTLIFASEGHGAVGDMDLFVTTRLDDSRWDLWSAPVNLGKGICTSGRDCDIALSADGSKALITRRSNLSQDLFSVTLPPAVKPQPVVPVRGTVRNSNDEPVATAIRWEDPVTAQYIGECRTNPKDGSFLFYLPTNQRYCCYVSDSLYLPESAVIDLSESGATQLSFAVTSYDQFCQQGMPITLKAVSYKVSDYQFSETSQSELIRLADIIRRQHLSVEIGSHIDGDSGDLDNQTLTQHRAEVIRNYLIKLGCNPDRINAVGYGSSRPVLSGHSDQNRTQNRRIEIRCLPSY